MTKNLNYNQCSRCILDTNDDPSIKFDDQGVCNHCHEYDNVASQYSFSDEERKRKLDEIITEIKENGKQKKYDCILGVSGGVDSTYLAYLAKQYDLRPLVVHFDNGWNSELAVKNIENILNKLGFDLYTYVVDWEEFKDLQLSYIKASVIDWEVPTDHGFIALLKDLSNKYNIQYVLSGHNIATEAVLPKNMRWNKLDVANIKAIHKKYGTIKLKTFPLLGFYKNLYYFFTNKAKWISLLNYVNYNKKEVKEFIQKELEWIDYGGKHYESIFTRFYQGYVLPEKFKVDKRKAHLSNLVCSGQITREEALEEIKKPPYDTVQLKIDKEFVIKKLDLTDQQFEEYMKQPNRSHLEFDSYETGLYIKYQKFISLIKPFLKVFKWIKNK